jgi:drug/metabolite transporter (DMT)-like permease
MSASACGFALMNFFAHVASREVHWTLIVATRGFVGAAVTFGIARVRGSTLVVRDRRGLLLRSGFGTVSMFCTFYALGEASLPLGDAVTLLNTTPIFLALLAPVLLGERGGRRVFFALPPSVAGLVLIVRPQFLFHGGSLAPSALIAAAVALLGGFSASIAWAMLRRIGPRESAEGITLWFSLIAATAALVLAAPHLSVPSPRALAAMLAAGGFGGLAQIAVTRAYALERAARVAGLAYLAVVVDAILGALALHEWPSAMTLVGMGLVVTGGLVVTLASVREHVRQGRTR